MNILVNPHHSMTESSSTVECHVEAADVETLALLEARMQKKRKKYNQITTSQRRKLLHMVKKEKISIKKAAERLCINYSTAKTILQLFKKTGRIERLEYRIQESSNDENGDYYEKDIHLLKKRGIDRRKTFHARFAYDNLLLDPKTFIGPEKDITLTPESRQKEVERLMSLEGFKNKETFIRENILVLNSQDLGTNNNFISQYVVQIEALKNDNKLLKKWKNDNVSSKYWKVFMFEDYGENIRDSYLTKNRKHY